MNLNKLKSDFKILVVEDDFIINMFIEDVLVNHGYSVVDVVINGKDAVDKVREHKPDLVIMDIGLKGEMNGIEAACLICEQSQTNIIFMTGNSDILSQDSRLDKVQPIATFLKPMNDFKLIQHLEQLFPEYQ